MATSGVVGRTQVTVAQLIDHAARRCGKLASTLTGEQLAATREAIGFMLSDLANRGLSLWCVQKNVLGTLENHTVYPLQTGTVDLLNALYRTGSAFSGAAISSAGTAANAFDGVLTTTCVAGTNGWVGLNLGLGNAAAAATCGVYMPAAATLNLVVDTSPDGVVWTTLYTAPNTQVAAGSWLYLELDNSATAQYWRVRETGGAAFTVGQVQFANNLYEVPMAALNRDDYVNYTNKKFNTPGGVDGKSLQYWYDKQVNPRMWVWPQVQSNFDQIVCWTQRQIQDVGVYSNTLDIPQRWVEGILFLIAHRMSLEIPVSELPQGRTELLLALSEKHLQQAESSERDGSSHKIAPMIRGYTA